jgi:Zn-dependent protease
VTDPVSLATRLATREPASPAPAHLLPGLGLRRVSERRRQLSVFGVPLEVDVSWVLGLGLATWTFADAALPVQVPDRGAGVYVLAGAVTAALVLGSVALHETGHWLAARRAGLPASRMSLTLVGGTLELEDGPRTPASELALAAAGPGTSLLAAAVAGLGHVVLVECGADPLAAAGAAVVAVANVALALFNLLPGLPLDGGHVLKAALWALTGDPGRADRLARRAGRALGASLLVLAMVASASGDAAAAIWSAALGVTVVNQA